MLDRCLLLSKGVVLYVLPQVVEMPVYLDLKTLNLPEPSTFNRGLSEVLEIGLPSGLDTELKARNECNVLVCAFRTIPNINDV